MYSVVRKTISIASLGSNGLPNLLGQPGPPGSGANIEVVQSSQTAFYRNNGPLSGSNTLQDSWRHQLAVSASRDGLPLVGVGIDPESHIFSAGVEFPDADPERRIISPGNPMVVPPSSQSSPFSISALTAFPQLGPVSGNSSDGSSVGFDATISPLGGLGFTFSWPLRIEAYYGAIPPRQQIRAPIRASFFIQSAATKRSEMLVCVDGRRRIEVEVITSGPPGAGDTYEVAAIRAGGGGGIERFLMQGATALDAVDDYLTFFATGPSAFPVAPFGPIIGVSVIGGPVSAGGLYTIRVIGYDEAP